MEEWSKIPPDVFFNLIKHYRKRLNVVILAWGGCWSIENRGSNHCYPFEISFITCLTKSLSLSKFVNIKCFCFLKCWAYNIAQYLYLFLYSIFCSSLSKDPIILGITQKMYYKRPQTKTFNPKPKAHNAPETPAASQLWELAHWLSTCTCA